MNQFSFTFKAWPMIATATIGLCFLTETAAGWMGIQLPSQANIDLVRAHLLHAFDSYRHFLTAASLVAQVILLLPIIEEFLFRWLMVQMPLRKIEKRRYQKLSASTNETQSSNLLKTRIGFALVSSALFSAAHYIAQPWPDSAFVALFFFGFAQCWLYEKTKRIWYPILNHGLFNLTNLFLLFLVPEAA